MLMLIGYDLTPPAADYDALGEALDKCGDQLSIHSGHRLVDSDQSPARVRDCIAGRLGLGPGDRILVLPVGGSWAHRGLDAVPAGGPSAADWLALRVQGSADELGVLALAYILHDTEGSDRKGFKKAIEGLSIYTAHGYLHPMNSLSLLATDRAPAAVCRELARTLENRGELPDELLVIPVRGDGACFGLSAQDLAWFKERGIKLAAPRKRARPSPLPPGPGPERRPAVPSEPPSAGVAA